DEGHRPALSHRHSCPASTVGETVSVPRWRHGVPHPGDTGQVRRGWWWLLLVAVVAVLVTCALDRQWLFSAGYGLAMAAVLVWTFPWRGRGGTSQAELDRLPADDPARAVVIYWRPGC